LVDAHIYNYREVGVKLSRRRRFLCPSVGLVGGVGSSKLFSVLVCVVGQPVEYGGVKKQVEQGDRIVGIYALREARAPSVVVVD